MNKELAETLKPLLVTRPMYGVFALGDGSCWFCAACGRRSEGFQMGEGAIPHKEDCQERAHWRAIGALKLALQDCGIDGV